MGRAPWTDTTAEDGDDAVVAPRWSRPTCATSPTACSRRCRAASRRASALARVLAQEARILLLDEPTAALDIRHQEQVLGVARSRADRGDAVVVVLHDLDLAAAYADASSCCPTAASARRARRARCCTAELLSDVYEHPIEVFRHPRTGGLVILPWRDERAGEHAAPTSTSSEEQQ